MTLHPEAQKRAQAELDAVLGDRLPTFADKDDLPYVTAIMKEVFRWLPVLPLAVPHRAVKPDRYKDFHIPAGASVLGNAWYVKPELKWFHLIFTPASRAILHDEAIYVEPGKFKPERFIDNNLPDPADSGAFGFGRRYVGHSTILGVMVTEISPWPAPVRGKVWPWTQSGLRSLRSYRCII
jgi:cytochrome P450